MPWPSLGVGLAGLVAPAVAEQPAAPPSVRIEIAGEVDARQRIEGLLRELFPPGGFDLHLVDAAAINPIDVVDPPEQHGEAAARIWIELGQPRRAVVYVTDGSWERVLIRRLSFEQLDAVALEEVAYVVDASVNAILEGGEIGIARTDAAAELGLALVPAAPEPGPPPPPPTVRPAWSITAGYRPRVWQRAALVHAPTLGVAVWAERKRLWIGGGLVGRAYLPVDVEAGNLRLGLRGGHVGALAELLFPVHRSVGIALEPGLGLDLWRDETTAVSAPAEAFPPTVRALPTLALDGGLDLWLGGRRDQVRVSLRGGIDVDLLGIRYVTADTGAVLFEPWRVRPGASLAIGWLRRARP